MLTQVEIAAFLASVRDVVASDLYAELQTEDGRAKANAVGSVLNLLIADLGHGNANAAERGSEWLRLARELAVIGIAGEHDGADAESGGRDAQTMLRMRLEGMQRGIESPAAHAQLVDALRAGSSPFVSWFKAAMEANVDLTRACRVDFHATRQESDAIPAADETARLRARLNDWLRARYPALPDPPIHSFRLRPGGYAKQTALFTLAPNPLLPEHLVLRLDMAIGITSTTVKDEFPVIRRAFELGLPVPEPVALETDASILGGAFMLMTEIRDSMPSGPHFPEERGGVLLTGAEFGRDLARVAARLHAGTRATHSDSIPDYARRVRELRDAWRAIAKSPYSIGAELGYAWLESHPLEKRRPWCLVHGDFGSHNILIRDGALAGVVDWELAHIGDPAEDLALFRMMVLPGIMEWDEFVREYIAAGGDPAACDEAAVGYFCVWLYLYHVQLSSALREKYLAGERADIKAANLVSHYLTLLMEYLARALKIAVDASIR